MRRTIRSSVLTLAGLLVMSLGAHAADTRVQVANLPGDAPRLLPQLSSEIARNWPSLEMRAFPAAIIDQESGWKLNSQLRTTREHGCGLGQFTIAWDARGRVRFDALAEMRTRDPELSGWNWRDCTAARYQLRAVVLKLEQADAECMLLMRDDREAKACDAARYNGGAGSVANRIRSCRLQTYCDPQQWFGQLETLCPQSRVRVRGYGEDFCTINSKYPGRVFARMPKFEGAM